jgi:hypothetical protein
MASSSSPQEAVRQPSVVVSESAAHDTTPSSPSTKDTAASDSDDSRFLRLPVELRNLIYEYAVTADTYQLYYHDAINIKDISIEITENIDGALTTRQMTLTERTQAYYTHPRVSGVQLCSTADTHKEYGQLKYVGKQLYRETRCLPLMYNVIIFVQDDQSPEDPIH